MRILIADDEKNIREWLKYEINRYFDCEIVGMASNGQEALEIFEKNEVNIIFTDIKMPIMDGLELLREVRKQHKTVYIVLLTAFSEFELAKQAVNEGADEYVLKTEMTSQFFRQLIDKIIEKTVLNLQRYTENEKSSQKAAIIKELIAAEDNISEDILKRCTQYNIRMKGMDLVAIAIFKTQFVYDFDYLEEKGIKHIVSFEYDETVYIIIQSIERCRGAQEQRHKLRGYIEKVVAINQCMLGIGQIKNDFVFIKEAIKEAIIALSIGFYKGIIKPYYYEFLDLTKLEMIDNQQKQIEELNRKIMLEDTRNQYKRIQEAFIYIQKEHIFLVNHLMNLYKDILNMIYVKYGNEELLLKNDFNKIKQQMITTYKVEEVCLLLLQVAKTYIKAEKMENKKSSKGIELAITYIKQNFQDPITLEQVAEVASFNTEYFSRVFKEEMGCTYSNYLTQLRLEKASQLLMCTNEKVKKIGEYVGYPNVSYFSTVFKKYYGINPHEYRKRNEKR